MDLKLRTIILIKIDLLKPGENLFDDLEGKEYQDLYEDIKREGIRTPLTVFRNEDGTYTIISGRQRYHIAKELDIREVPCIIEEGSRIRAIFGLEVFRRHLSPQKKAAIEAKREELEREEMRSEIIPKLIPELAAKYESGDLTVDQALEIVRCFPKEKQFKILTAFEVVREVAPDNVAEQIKSLEGKVRDLQDERLKLKNDLFEKETAHRKLKRAESELRETMQDEIEAKLEKTKHAISEILKNQYDEEAEKLASELRNLSLIADERMREIDKLKETIRKTENEEKGFRSEIQAQKIRYSELESQHKTEIEKYARPDLVVKQVNHIVDLSEATLDHLRSFVYSYSDDARGNIKQALQRLAQFMNEMVKELSARELTVVEAQVLPFQKPKLTGRMP